MIERIKTARGSFRVASQSREELEALGYGYYCEAGDGEHIIMGNGTRALAVRIQPEPAAEPETDTTATDTAESEAESESVESVESVENDVCNASENATTNEQNGGAENPSTAREEYKMRRMMRFASQNEYDKWVEEQQEHCEHIDEVVTIVDDGRELTAELVTECTNPVTATLRLFEGLGGVPELDDWQERMVEAVGNGVYSGSTDDGEWKCANVGDEYYNGYHVSLTVYRGQVDEVKEIALSAIAREFGKQQKYHDEKWSYGLPDTNDYVVQYWYDWRDNGGVRHKDYVGIWLSDACRMAGVDFDVVDDGDIEGRMLVEMVDRGYTVDDDNEIVIDDGADEYAICEEMDEIRSDLWEQAQNEAEQARDELCYHEDLSEPWFRELCEEMLAKVNATLAGRHS